MSLEKTIEAGTQVRLKKPQPGLTTFLHVIRKITEEGADKGKYLLQDERERVLPFPETSFDIVSVADRQSLVERSG